MARKSESLYDAEPEFETGNQGGQVQSYNGFEIESDVPMGQRARGTRQAKYPFDMLEVGQSFHVPATEDMPKPAVTLAGAVTNANEKWSHDDPNGATETKKVSVFAKDENGKRIRLEDGGFEKIGEEVVTVPVRVDERRFVIRSVGNEDRKGPGARVFREL